MTPRTGLGRRVRDPHGQRMGQDCVLLLGDVGARARVLAGVYVTVAEHACLGGRPNKTRSDSFARHWVCPGTAFQPRFTRVVPVVSQPFVISLTNPPLSCSASLRGSSCGHFQLCGFGVSNTVCVPHSSGRVSGALPPIGGFPLLVHRRKGRLFSNGGAAFSFTRKQTARIGHIGRDPPRLSYPTEMGKPRVRGSSHGGFRVSD